VTTVGALLSILHYCSYNMETGWAVYAEG
jgi:hypothetical protein